MSTGVNAQLLAFNIAVLLTLFGLGAAAKPGDRLVYIVHPPWLSPIQIENQIGALGARSRSVRGLPFLLEVAVPNPQILARLTEELPVLAFAAAPSSICTNWKGSAR